MKPYLTKFKKLTTLLFVVMFALLTSFIPVKAATGVTTEEGTGIEYRDDGSFGFFGQLSNFYADGALAYCVEPHVVFSPGTRTAITIDEYQSMDLATKKRVQLIDYYAKLLGANSNQNVRATAQFMIWETVHPQFFVSKLTFDNYSHAIYNDISSQINSRIATHTNRPSFHLQSHTLKVGESLTLTDTNGYLNEFTLFSTDSNVLSMTQSGNTLTVTAHAAGNASVVGQKVPQQYVGTSLIFLGDGSQDIGTFKVDDPVNVGVTFTVEQNTGNIRINKQGTSGEAVPNAQFALSSNPDMSNPLGTYTTGAEGFVTIANLEQGSYFVQEVSVPNPYLLEQTIHPLTVVPGETALLTKTNEVAQGRITITKTNTQGEKVRGATYNVLDSSGSIVATVTTDADGVATTGNLPLGNYTLVETSVPAPYLLDVTPIVATLVYANQTTPVVSAAVTQTNEVAQGQFSIHKTDSEIADLHLEGAEYEIRNVDDVVVGTLVTDAQGNATSPVLPLGTYTYQEVKAPVGYNLDETVHTVNLAYQDMNTPIVSVHQEVTNDVIKGQIQVVKVNADDEEVPVPNVVFNVLSVPERKVVDTITTDVDGFAFTKDLRFGDYILVEVEAPQEFYLNENEYSVSIREHGKVVVQYVANDEILVKLGIEKDDVETNEPLANAIFEVHDENGNVVTFEYLNENYEIVTQTQLVTNAQGKAFTRGFLKYGTYTLVEVQAPLGYIKADPIEFTIDRNTKVVDLAVIGSTMIQPVSNAKTTTEIHKVDIYGDFLPGATLTLLDGEEEIVTFTSSDVAFEIKGLEIGKTYTLREDVAPEGYLLSEPVDITIEETRDVQVLEMVNERIPELQTTALFEDGYKESLPQETLRVVDLVDVTNLWIGKEYTLKGTLVDAETEEVITTSDVVFEAEAEEMTVEVVFEFEGSSLAGKTFVVFEDLYKDNRLLATHAELTDEKQTVRIPEIHTEAHDIDGLKEVLPFEEVTIVDKVTYKALTVGEEYTMKGELLSKRTGQTLAESEVTFTPTNSFGFVELTFVFNASDLAGSEVVVFETLYNGLKVVAEHTDFNDPKQTVKITEPTVKTSASTIERHPEAPSTVIIVDKVTYTGLVIGKEYKVDGILMDKATEQPFLADGKTIEATHSFVAEKSEGFVELTFTLDSKYLKKGEVVVFEDLSHEGILLASHRDINDANQTVQFVEISIKKVDSLDETKVLKQAEFTLSQNGLVLETKETNAEGLATFVVEVGSYQLKETKAPVGYRLSNEVIDVVITGQEANLEYQVTAQNTPLPLVHLPSTGSMDPLGWFVFGVSFVVLGFFFVVRRQED